MTTPHYIPPLKAIREAYYCVIHCWPYHLLISFLVTLPYTGAGLMGWLDPLLVPTSPLEPIPAGYYNAMWLILLTVIIWPIPCVVLWQRLYLLGPACMFRKRLWPLVSRTVQFVIISLIFFGVIAAIGGGMLFLLMTLIAPLLDDLTTVKNVEMILLGTSVSLILLLLLVASVRLGLVFVSQAIGRQMNFRTAWRLTRYNTVRMLSICITGIAPMLAVFIMVVFAVRVTICPTFLMQTVDQTPYADWLLLFALSPILSLPLAYLAAQMSVFYRCLGVGDAWMDGFLKAGPK